jgi:hypothetical protein
MGIYCVFGNSSWRRPAAASFVAELITSMIKTATLASNKVQGRMQIWQMHAACLPSQLDRHSRFAKRATTRPDDVYSK